MVWDATVETEKGFLLLSALLSTSKRLHYSYEEYLTALKDGTIKLGYCDGVIYAMGGWTPAHSELAFCTGTLLRRMLPLSCRIFTADLKIRVEACGLATFPDVSVVCGERQLAPGDSLALVNPSLIVEITSPSTEDYDRSDKLSHSKQISSLKAVVFVSHRMSRVTVIERVDGKSIEREFRGTETVQIAEPRCSFGVDELYAGVVL